MDCVNKKNCSRTGYLLQGELDSKTDTCKDWPYVSVLVLKSMVDDVGVLAVGYKYHSTKVIYIILKRNVVIFLHENPYEAIDGKMEMKILQ